MTKQTYPVANIWGAWVRGRQGTQCTWWGEVEEGMGGNGNGRRLGLGWGTRNTVHR